MTETAIQEQKTYAVLKPEESDGLVLHCADPRFQEAFARFIREELGMKQPIPFVVPGGIHDFVSPVRVKAARQLWQQLEFMIKEGNVKRLVIINHDDCKWYGRWNTLVSTTVGEDIAHHLMKAAELLFEKKFRIDVECYVARLEGDKVTFERVDTPAMV